MFVLYPLSPILISVVAFFKKKITKTDNRTLAAVIGCAIVISNTGSRNALLKNYIWGLELLEHLKR